MAETPAQDQTAQAAEAEKGTGIPMGITGDIEIYPSRPLEAHSSHGAPAYEARDRRVMGEQFALLCGRATVPRVTNIGSYKNLRNPGLLRLVEAGIVNWAPDGRQRYALLFEKPRGRKLLEHPDGVPYRIPEERLVAAMIQPVLSVLSDFRNVDMVHGGINLQNMYVVGAEGSETVILGECLTSAPSVRQHLLYETIERGMAQPSGRGQGTLKEDLYAFGVCLAMVARGENIMRGKTEAQILADKLEHGSYGIVIGRERLPPGIAEFLRGVLNDDERQRWDIEDAMRWLEGRRLSPKQPRVPLKAARPFIFREHKYWELRSIAMAFANNVADAAMSIEKDQFELWIKRNFEDQVLEDRLAKVWEREKSSGRDKLISSVSMVLDPLAPVRYKSLSILPGGYGTALAEAFARQEDVQVYAEMVSQQIFNYWINLRFEEIPDATGFITNFEKCRNFLTQKMPGYGIERVLYTLNKEAACMSPLLKDFIVLTPGALLTALEGLARRGEKTEKVLDRHMIAFISVRESKMIDPHLGQVISQDRGAQLLGVTRTLAAIQKRFSVGAVPSVSSWLVSMMEPVYNRYNDRDLRAEVKKRMGKLNDTGNLAAILELIDDPRLVQDDIQRYMMARHEYAMLSQEKTRIYGLVKGKRQFGYATGRQVSMIVSSVLGAIGIISYVGLQLLAKL